MFRNRKRELAFLLGLAEEKKPKLVVLYGRRRVGKTELLKEFSKRHKALYLLARRESEKNQLDKMGRDTAEFFKDSFLEKNQFNNYDAFFEYINSKPSVPVIIDEFPYLVESNKGLPSILQDYWDNKLSKSGAFFILCGSSVSMMESLLGYKSPLYGRRTEQILLEPLKFTEAREFMGGKPPEEQIVIYAILGGTPGYLLQLDLKLGLKENVIQRILTKNTFLNRDVEFVLREELSEPRNYFSIIKSIANGNATLGSITNDTGLPRNVVIKYLSVLSDLHITERTIPITEKQTSRKGVYSIRDNYFRFWFRFVFENLEYIEQDKQRKLYMEKIRPELPAFVGRAFEEISLEWAKEEYKDFIFGRWWGGEEEIDGVGMDKTSGRMVFLEAKWSDLDSRTVRKELDRLREKAQKVRADRKSEEFVLVAKRLPPKLRLKPDERAVSLAEIIKAKPMNT